MKSRLLVVLAAVAVAVPLATPSSANRGGRASYDGAGTVVVKDAGKPATLDEGVTVCRTGAPEGFGGACLPFAPAPAQVHVLDDAFGEDVPFQVCIDNNGDGLCVSPDKGPCADGIFFSHDDEGIHHNPVGPLPGGFTPGCPGGPWKGYVVFLCNGVAHNTGGGSHSHPATSGTITSSSGLGEGVGNFCGGSTQDPSNKQYVLVP